jgi:hypothetical protein
MTRIPQKAEIEMRRHAQRAHRISAHLRPRGIRANQPVVSQLGDLYWMYPPIAVVPPSTQLIRIALRQAMKRQYQAVERERAVTQWHVTATNMTTWKYE